MPASSGILLHQFTAKGSQRLGRQQQGLSFTLADVLLGGGSISTAFVARFP